MLTMFKMGEQQILLSKAVMRNKASRCYCLELSYERFPSVTEKSVTE
jgi:hypothetical protein